MPMGPASLTNWLRCIVSRLDTHVRNPAFVLPFREMLTNVLLNLAFSIQVFFGNRSKLVIEGSFAFSEFHPMDRVEALLVNIVSSRPKIRLFPGAQLITSGPVGSLKITSES